MKMNIFIFFFLCIGVAVVVVFAFEDDCHDVIEIINNVRSLHESPPLKCQAKLSKIAKKFALKLSKSCSLTGEHKLEDDVYGENRHMYGTNGKHPTPTDDKSMENAINSWYSGEKCYNYSDPSYGSCNHDCRKKDGSCAKKTGTFTQLIWKETEEIGLGVSHCYESEWRWTIVIGIFKFPGNYKNRFSINVLPRVTKPHV